MRSRLPERRELRPRDPAGDAAARDAAPRGARWRAEPRGVLALSEAHQIATFADFCNDCGNCDVFCPEDGGPYVVKPRFFGSERTFRAHAADGFFLRRDDAGDLVLARVDGHEYRLVVRDRRAEFQAGGVTIVFDPDDPARTAEGDAPAGTAIDLGVFQIMDLVREGIFADGAVNYVNCLGGASAEADHPRPVER